MYIVTASLNDQMVGIIKSTNVPVSEKFLVEDIMFQYEVPASDIVICAYKVQEGQWTQFYCVKGDTVVTNAKSRAREWTWG